MFGKWSLPSLPSAANFCNTGEKVFWAVVSIHIIAAASIYLYMVTNPLSEDASDSQKKVYNDLNLASTSLMLLAGIVIGLKGWCNWKRPTPENNGGWQGVMPGN